MGVPFGGGQHCDEIGAARAGTLRFVLLAEACEPVTREVADEEALERAWWAVSRP